MPTDGGLRGLGEEWGVGISWGQFEIEKMRTF